MSIPNENMKIVTINDSARPEPKPVDLRAAMPRNEEEKSAREYLLGAVRKRDEALARIEEILDNHSFGYDVDAPIVVEADLIRDVLSSLRGA